MAYRMVGILYVTWPGILYCRKEGYPVVRAEEGREVGDELS